MNVAFTLKSFSKFGELSMLNISFGSYANPNKIIAIITPDLPQTLHLLDTTQRRKFHSIIITDDSAIFSSLTPAELNKRIFLNDQFLGVI